MTSRSRGRPGQSPIQKPRPTRGHGPVNGCDQRTIAAARQATGQFQICPSRSINLHRTFQLPRVLGQPVGDAFLFGVNSRYSAIAPIAATSARSKLPKASQRVDAVEVLKPVRRTRAVKVRPCQWGQRHALIFSHFGQIGELRVRGEQFAWSQARKIRPKTNSRAKG